PHGKDIADNPSDTGGCALERFDRARMIVALHLERDGPTIADIDNPCVFLTGFYQNAGPCSRKFLQFFLRVFIGAMLTHITEKIPSSVKFGWRPRIFLIRSNSSRVRPCCLTSSGVTAGSAVGIWLIIDRFTLTNPQDGSIVQNKNFHQVATF